jgi:hypothetical protein
MDKETTKVCEIHGPTIYILRSDKRYRCKKCASESVIKRRKNLKKKSVEYKGGKCIVCGYDRSIEALHFHHLDNTQKDFGISQGGFTRSWEKVKNEIDKCVLVCSNCHSEIHSNLIDITKFI